MLRCSIDRAAAFSGWLVPFSFCWCSKGCVWQPLVDAGTVAGQLAGGGFYKVR